MTDFQAGFLSLIRSALTEAPPALPGDFDFGRAYALAERHQVLPLIYYGAMCDPDFMSHPMAESFFQRTCVYISYSARQQETVEELCRLLDRTGVDYMPLKGSVLKALYPRPEMRIMGDADILIHMEDYPRVTPVMESLKGTPLSESDHEYIWRLPSHVVIELHKRIIPSYNRDYYAYFGDGWRFARPIAPGARRHDMTAEDKLIYLVAHFAKHYRDKGAGVKYVVDLYVFHRAYPHPDMTYLEKELKKLGLWDFFGHIQRLIEVWFGDGESDGRTDFLTDRIFDDGVFGREERGAVSDALRLSGSARSAKRMRTRHMLFPPYGTMCNRHPILKKWPILLPLLWILRLLTTVFSHRDRMENKRKQLALMSEENVAAYGKELSYVGLGFGMVDGGTPPEEGGARDGEG